MESSAESSTGLHAASGYREAYHCVAGDFSLNNLMRRFTLSGIISVFSGILKAYE
jgi:hypothetical protein